MKFKILLNHFESFATKFFLFQIADYPRALDRVGFHEELGGGNWKRTRDIKHQNKLEKISRHRSFKICFETNRRMGWRERANEFCLCNTIRRYFYWENESPTLTFWQFDTLTCFALRGKKRTKVANECDSKKEPCQQHNRRIVWKWKWRW